MSFILRRIATTKTGKQIVRDLALPGDTISLGRDSGNAIQSFQMAFRDYGYGIPTDGVFDQFTYDVVLAFQRHFRPARCDGRVDSSTLITLRRLFETRSRRSQAVA